VAQGDFPGGGGAIVVPLSALTRVRGERQWTTGTVEVAKRAAKAGFGLPHLLVSSSFRSSIGLYKTQKSLMFLQFP